MSKEVIDLNKVLPTETAAQFKVVDTKRKSTKVFYAKFGEVDFSVLSVKRAQQLVDSGAKFITKTAKNESKSATADK